MLKQTLITLTMCLCCLTATSQERSFSTDRAGKWNVSLVMGSGDYLNEALLDEDILLSGYNGLSDIGLDGVTPSLYFSSDSYNSNSITNIAGLEIGYFLSNSLELTLSATATIGSTPSVDYVEGVQLGESASMLDIPGYQYVEGRLDQRCMGSVGLNYYISTGSQRVNIILGAECAYNYASLETSLPYTGEVTVDGEAVEIYQNYICGGSAQTLSGVFVAGVEYLVSENFVLGIRFSPITYTYGLISMVPQGYDDYHVSHTSVKIFSFPKLKFGFRF